MKLIALTGFHFARTNFDHQFSAALHLYFFVLNFLVPPFIFVNHNFMDVFIGKYLLRNKMRIWATEFYLDELKGGNQKEYMAYTDTYVHTHIDSVIHTCTHTCTLGINHSEKKKQNCYYRRSILKASYDSAVDTIIIDSNSVFLLLLLLHGKMENNSKYKIPLSRIAVSFSDRNAQKLRDIDFPTNHKCAT